jgi:molybdopterin molybdotransferase
MPRLSYPDALACVRSIASSLTPLATEHLSPTAALGRVLATPIRASRAAPPFDNSAMDGFCVSSAATLRASHDAPLTLRVVGRIAAGDAPPTYDERTAADVC